MKKNWRKVLSFVLVLAMVLGMTTAAYADEVVYEEAATEAAADAVGEAAAGAEAEAAGEATVEADAGETTEATEETSVASEEEASEAETEAGEYSEETAVAAEEAVAEEAPADAEVKATTEQSLDTLYGWRVTPPAGKTTAVLTFNPSTGRRILTISGGTVMIETVSDNIGAHMAVEEIEIAFKDASSKLKVTSKADAAGVVLLSGNSSKASAVDQYISGGDFTIDDKGFKIYRVSPADYEPNEAIDYQNYTINDPIVDAVVKLLYGSDLGEWRIRQKINTNEPIDLYDLVDETYEQDVLYVDLTNSGDTTFYHGTLAARLDPPTPELFSPQKIKGKAGILTLHENQDIEDGNQYALVSDNIIDEKPVGSAENPILAGPLPEKGAAGDSRPDEIQFTGLKADQKYYLAVRAVSESEFASDWSISDNPPPPAVAWKDQPTAEEAKALIREVPDMVSDNAFQIRTVSQLNVPYMYIVVSRNATDGRPVNFTELKKVMEAYGSDDADPNINKDIEEVSGENGDTYGDPIKWAYSAATLGREGSTDEDITVEKVNVYDKDYEAFMSEDPAPGTEYDVYMAWLDTAADDEDDWTINSPIALAETIRTAEPAEAQVSVAYPTEGTEIEYLEFATVSSQFAAQASGKRGPADLPSRAKTAIRFVRAGFEELLNLINDPPEGDESDLPDVGNIDIFDANEIVPAGRYTIAGYVYDLPHQYEPNQTVSSAEVRHFTVIPSDVFGRPTVNADLSYESKGSLKYAGAYGTYNIKIGDRLTYDDLKVELTDKNNKALDQYPGDVVGDVTLRDTYSYIYTINGGGLSNVTLSANAPGNAVRFKEPGTVTITVSLNGNILQGETCENFDLNDDAAARKPSVVSINVVDADGVRAEADNEYPLYYGLLDDYKEDFRVKDYLNVYDSQGRDITEDANTKYYVAGRIDGTRYAIDQEGITQEVLNKLQTVMKKKVGAGDTLYFFADYMDGKKYSNAVPLTVEKQPILIAGANNRVSENGIYYAGFEADTKNPPEPDISVAAVKDIPEAYNGLISVYYVSANRLVYTGKSKSMEMDNPQKLSDWTTSTNAAILSSYLSAIKKAGSYLNWVKLSVSPKDPNYTILDAQIGYQKERATVISFRVSASESGNRIVDITKDMWPAGKQPYTISNNYATVAYDSESMNRIEIPSANFVKAGAGTINKWKLQIFSGGGTVTIPYWDAWTHTQSPSLNGAGTGAKYIFSLGYYVNDEAPVEDFKIIAIYDDPKKQALQETSELQLHVEPLESAVFYNLNHVCINQPNPKKSEIPDLNLSVTAVINGKEKTLEYGRDFTATYKNNKMAADKTAEKAPTVILKGKGEFKGLNYEQFFTIEKADIRLAPLNYSGLGNYYYVDTATKQVVSMKSAPVFKLKDYTIKKQNYSLIYEVNGEKYQVSGTDKSFTLKEPLTQAAKVKMTIVINDDANVRGERTYSEAFWILPVKPQNFTLVRGLIKQSNLAWTENGVTVESFLGDEGQNIVVHAGSKDKGTPLALNSGYEAHFYDTHKKLITGEDGSIGGDSPAAVIRQAGKYLIGLTPTDAAVIGTDTVPGVQYATIFINIEYGKDKLDGKQFSVQPKTVTFGKTDLVSANVYKEVKISTGTINAKEDIYGVYTDTKLTHEVEMYDIDAHGFTIHVTPQDSGTKKYYIRGKNRYKTTDNFKVKVKVTVKAVPAEHVTAIVNEDKENGKVPFNAGGYVYLPDSWDSRGDQFGRVKVQLSLDGGKTVNEYLTGLLKNATVTIKGKYPGDKNAGIQIKGIKDGTNTIINGIVKNGKVTIVPAALEYDTVFDAAEGMNNTKPLYYYSDGTGLLYKNKATKMLDAAGEIVVLYQKSAAKGLDASGNYKSVQLKKDTHYTLINSENWKVGENFILFNDNTKKGYFDCSYENGLELPVYAAEKKYNKFGIKLGIDYDNANGKPVEIKPKKGIGFAYTGEAIKPALNITLDGTPVKRTEKGDDYVYELPDGTKLQVISTTYSNNFFVGNKAKVTVMFSHGEEGYRYTGTKDITFKIKKTSAY